MRFFKETLKYLKKNFLILIIFAIIPAVILAINNSNIILFSLFRKILDGEQSFNFLQIFKYFSLIDYRHIGFSIINFIVIILFLSFILAFIEKHMRIGKKSFKSLFGKINDNLIPVTILSIVLIGICEIWAVLTSAFIILMAELFVSNIVRLLLSLFISFTMFLVLFTIIGVIVMWLPTMLITGFNYGEAFTYSISLIADKKIKIAISLIIPVLAMTILGIIIDLLLGEIAGFIILIIAYVIYFIYYSSLSFVIYFDLTETEREDNKKYFN